MNRYEVLIEDTGERYDCREDRNLLEGMEALGRKGVPVGCRHGGCGVCKGPSHERRVQHPRHEPRACERGPAGRRRGAGLPSLSIGPAEPVCPGRDAQERVSTSG